MTPQEGDILAGKYRIEKLLGAGGMGMVVAATHLQLEERVALKFLLPETVQNGEAVARFTREARAAVKIKSEHVARVTDVGKLDNGAPYMVMEYLTGTDLSERVRAQGPLEVHEATELMLQACEALSEAHGLGIVHRDLKPANLFLTQRANGSRCLKILDFGISKMSASGDGRDLGMTSTSAVIGSPLYMSPEQMSSARDVDLRTDIWAMGVILYELVSGRLPFEAESLGQLCGMILSQPPRPLQEVRPGVPAELVAVIERCLQKDRGQRFGSVAELAMELYPFAPRTAAMSYDRIVGATGGIGAQRGGPVAMASAPDIAVSPAGASSVAASTNAAWGQTAPGRPPRSALVLAVAAVALLAVTAAAGGLLLWRRASAEQAAATSSGVTAPSAVPEVVSPPADPAAPVPSATSTASSAPALASESASPLPAAAPKPRPVLAAAREKKVATPSPPPPAVKPAPAKNKFDALIEDR